MTDGGSPQQSAPNSAHRPHCIVATLTIHLCLNIVFKPLVVFYLSGFHPIFALEGASLIGIT